MTALMVVLSLLVQDVDVKSRLKGTKVTVEFKDADLQTFINALSDATDLNFALYGIDRHHAHVDLILTDVSAETVLALALMDHKLAYRIDGGVVLIERRDAHRRLRTAGYDVRDLLFVTRDFPGVDLDFGNGRGAGIGIVEPDAPIETGRDDRFEASWLVELIRAHTGGGSWEEDERVAISVFDNCLFVKQSDEVHKQIETLVDQLRKVK